MRSPAQMPVSEDARAHATYTCQRPESASAQARAATALSIQTSDKNALACAADLRFELAKKTPDSREAQVAALSSLLAYVDHIHALKRFDLIHMNWAEFDLRLQHAADLTSQLAASIKKKWPDDPALTILTAAIDGSLAGPNDPQTTLSAVERLKAAVARDPQALGGLGEILIGRSYLDLPPLFGGSPLKAIPYLEQARQVSPNDPRALRYLAEAYDEVGKSEDALRSLTVLAKVQPREDDLQLFADEWRMGEGLAARMQADALASNFAARRADLMRQHPNLLLRKVESVFGHGGDDPISGKPQYSGEAAQSH